jgi:hypothetical protein
MPHATPQNQDRNVFLLLFIMAYNLLQLILMFCFSFRVLPIVGIFPANEAALRVMLIAPWFIMLVLSLPYFYWSYHVALEFNW